MAKQDRSDDQYAIVGRNDYPAQLIHSSTANSGTVLRRTGETSGAAHSHITGGTVETNAIELTGFNGGSVAVGSTSAVELTFTGVTQGILVQADHDNSNTVFLGPSNIDEVGANALWRLEPGDALELTLNDASAPLFARGGDASQKVWKSTLT